MAQASETIHHQPQEYQFPLPLLDTRLSPSVLGAIEGTGFPVLVGVDGREAGKLKRFPGFYETTNFMSSLAVRRRYAHPDTGAETTATVTITYGSHKGVKMIRPFFIQKDVRSDTTLRGWVFLAHFTDNEATTDDIDCLVAHYYDSSTSTWFTEVILELTVPYIAVSGRAVSSHATVFYGDPNQFLQGQAVNAWVGGTIYRDSPTLASGPITTSHEQTITSSTTLNWDTSTNIRMYMHTEKVLRYVDYLDVAVKGRQIYVVGQRSTDAGASKEAISVAVRCNASYFTSAALEGGGTRVVTRGQAESLTILDASDTATKKGTDAYLGWIFAANLAGGVDYGIVTRSSPDVATAAAFETCLGFFPALAPASGSETVKVSVTPPKWVCAPMRAGTKGTVIGRDTTWATDVDIPFIDLTGANNYSGGSFSVTLPTGGQLSAGNYVIAIRLIAPEQEWYSNLSTLTTIPAVAADKIQSAAVSTATLNSAGGVFQWPAKWINFHTRKIVQLWRSTAGAVVPGTDTPAGSLYLDKEVELADGENTAQLVWGDVVPDDSLLLLTALDGEEVSILPKDPPAKGIEEYEGMLFRVCTPEDNDNAVDLDALRWSPPERTRVNYLPLTAKRTPPNAQTDFKVLAPSGTFLSVLSDNEILRLHRSGTKVAIDTIHNRYGVVGSDQVLSVGTILYIVSPVGLLVCDLVSGSLEALGAVQHVFDRDWRASLPSIRMGYDSRLGAVFILNTTEKECLIIWMNEGVATMLHYVPFDDVVTSPDPIDRGALRAFFVEETSGRMFRVDDDGQADTATMNGGAGPSTVGGFSYNPAVTVAVSTTSCKFAVPDAAASDTRLTALVGMPVAFVAMTDTADNFVVRYIATATRVGAVATITWSGVLESAPAVGDILSLAPIVFKWVGHPVSGNPSTPVMDLFHVKKVTGMASALEDYVVDAAQPTPALRYRLLKGDLTTQLAETTKAMSVTPSATTAPILANAPTLLPCVEQWSSDCPFSLTGVLVSRTIERSRV